MNYPLINGTGIWAETSEQWDDAHPSWKIVGNNPRRILKKDFSIFLHHQDLSYRSSLEHLFESDRIFYLVSFSSGRMCIASSRFIIEPGSYVIVEADRGEDCAHILEKLDKDSIINDPIKDCKLILRRATKQDIDILEFRKIQEERAMEKCTNLIKEKGLSMKVTGCEFQWDQKKITFYFKSEKRIDFRDLVKELFKFYRIRIWMSMENKKNAEDLLATNNLLERKMNEINKNNITKVSNRLSSCNLIKYI